MPYFGKFLKSSLKFTVGLKLVKLRNAAIVLSEPNKMYFFSYFELTLTYVTFNLSKFKPLHATDPYIYPLKTSENCFYHVLRTWSGTKRLESGLLFYRTWFLLNVYNFDVGSSLSGMAKDKKFSV